MYDRGAPSDLGVAECTLEETFLYSGIFEEVGNPDTHDDLDVAFEARDVQELLGDFCTEGDKGDSSEALMILGETFGGIPFISLPVPNIGIDQLVKANK